MDAEECSDIRDEKLILERLRPIAEKADPPACQCEVTGRYVGNGHGDGGYYVGEDYILCRWHEGTITHYEPGTENYFTVCTSCNHILDTLDVAWEYVDGELDAPMDPIVCTSCKDVPGSGRVIHGFAKMLEEEG